MVDPNKSSLYFLAFLLLEFVAVPDMVEICKSIVLSLETYQPFTYFLVVPMPEKPHNVQQEL